MVRWLKTNLKAVTAALLALLCGLLGAGLLERSSAQSALVRASYDSYFAWLDWGDSSASGTNAPVVIVYLDQESHERERQDPTVPWPRALHAQLLQRLKTAGARAVVFDVWFDQAGGDPAGDALLRDAIAAQGGVVLAGELRAASGDSGRGNWGRASRLIPPYEPLQRAAAGWGVDGLAADPDFVVRRYYSGIADGTDWIPSLVGAAGRVLKLGAETAEIAASSARWLRYYGPPFQLPHRSLSQVLHAGDVDAAEFRDKIVFVGARPLVGTFGERRDEFRSPNRLGRAKDYFMPGVEVHATEFLNLIRGDWLRRLDGRLEIALLWLAGLAVGSGLFCLRPVPATATAAGAAIAIVLGAALAFHRGHIWFPWLIVAGVQLPAALGGSVLFHSWEGYRVRRRLEAAQRLADARIREQAALIDKAHDAILVQEPGGRISYLNPSAERLFGWTLSEWSGAEARQFLETPAVKAARQLALERGEWNGELQCTTRFGKTLSLESRWTLLRDAAGGTQGLLLMISDVTEKKQLEAESMRLQRMEAVGSLASGMAHDLNNALAPILMGTQLLRREMPDENAHRILSLMEASTRRGAEMVRQVLLFARGRTEEMVLIDPGLLVREAEKLARDTFPRNIVVTAQIAPDLWPVRGNTTQLHQVLLNLCVNARDAMPEGGSLSLAADPVALTAETARAIPEGRAGEFVVVMISDTGVGIAPEILPRIFEAFFTTKAEGKGTGLGLSTTARIVKAHGGFIAAQSQAGEGTTFEIYLPRLVAPEAGEAGREVWVPQRGGGEWILVADDDAAVRELLRRCLEEHGYRVVVAANGVEAVSIFKHRAFQIALVISDVAMPLLDGIQAVAAIRQMRGDVPVLFLSGEREVSAGGGVGDPPVEPLPKPVELGALLEAVRRGLEAGRK